MIIASYEDKGLTSKLKIFSTSLGDIANKLLQEVGDKMACEAKSKAPVKTGKTRDAINFFITDNNEGILTTKKKLKKNVWYSNIIEHGTKERQAKRKPFMVFKINGEWKKVKTAKALKPKPFMKPVFEDYFGSESGKGYKLLADALLNTINKELE